MNKGFANILLIIGVAVATLAGSIFYTNHEKQNINSSLNKLGATIATTSLSDTIGTFRTNVNTSLENINTQVGTISSTISAFGNIVSQNTPLAVSVGGTGTTTAPSGYQFLSSSGTFPTWKTLASSTGITITHTATSTIIGTAGFDSSANIAFTGNNTHSGSETFTSSTFITISTATSTASKSSDPLNILPAGAIQMYASSSAPIGWLLADGTSYATSTYPRLWALIGYQYGGSGANFNVPNINGRVVIGPSSTISAVLGATGGSTSTSVGIDVPQSGALLGCNSGCVTLNYINGHVTSTVQVLDPYIILNYIIKY